MEKLARIFAQNDIHSITVARMEIPCCSGMVGIVRRALEVAGREVSPSEVVVGVKGDIKTEG